MRPILVGALLGAALLVPPNPTGEPAGLSYAWDAADGRRFLAYDPRGDGRAVEVVGDLDGADRMAVLVPGSDTTLRDFDRGLGGVARRAPAVQARAIAGAARAADPAARIAVVAWLGYDAPDGLGLEVAREVSARDGARDLAAFLAELAARRPAARITVVGHSYGAVVVGLAARSAPPQVTDVVALGAPGMGVDRAADLRTGVRVWAALAADDWIRRVPQGRLLGLGHGTRPSTAAFGARALPTADAAGHDGYLAAGSPTLAALAAVVTHGDLDPPPPSAGVASAVTR
jgi:pimeloyl-ACP methyl ester carboxylesterase